MWWLGDFHLTPTIAEYEKFFEIPPLEDISPENQASLKADLEEFGFTRKPDPLGLPLGVRRPDRERRGGLGGGAPLPDQPAGAP